MLALGCAGICSADDGWVPLQGSESSLNEHPTIQMKSEVVVATIHQKYADVDCRFRFVNHGGATDVRMGFPDQSSQGEISASIYEKFKSYVDGKIAKTKFEVIDNNAWQTKTVHFAKGETKIVRNTYRVDHTELSLGPIGKFIQGFDYVLRTGATWQGKIEQCEVRVTFDKGVGPQKLTSKSLMDGAECGAFAQSLEFWKSHPNGIVWSGPCKPKISGRTLTYLTTNLEPTEKSDIGFLFGPLVTRK